MCVSPVTRMGKRRRWCHYLFRLINQGVFFQYPAGEDGGASGPLRVRQVHMHPTGPEVLRPRARYKQYERYDKNTEFFFSEII